MLGAYARRPTPVSNKADAESVHLRAVAGSVVHQTKLHSKQIFVNALAAVAG